MKRIVFGIVIAAMVAAAGSVHAATVLEKDNFTYKISGDWQIQFRQDAGEDQDLDVEYDDLELKNHVDYKINDSVTAFGQLDFGFKNAADKSNENEGPHLEEAFVGFKIKDIKLFVGKTDSAGDEFGIQGTKETIVADDAFNEYGVVDGDDLIGISAKFADMFKVVAAYEIEAESEKSNENGTFYDIFVAMDLKGVSLGAAYQNVEAYESDAETTVWGVQASYDAGFASLAVDYSVADDDVNEIAIWNLFVAVPIKAVTLGAGYVSLNPENDTAEDENDTADDITGWYANVIYKVPSAKNVRLFAEVGGSDEEDHDLGYLVGLRIKF
jgi:predicted porin